MSKCKRGNIWHTVKHHGAAAPIDLRDFEKIFKGKCTASSKLCWSHQILSFESRFVPVHNPSTTGANKGWICTLSLVRLDRFQHHTAFDMGGKNRLEMDWTAGLTKGLFYLWTVVLEVGHMLGGAELNSPEDHDSERKLQRNIAVYVTFHKSTTWAIPWVFNETRATL